MDWINALSSRAEQITNKKENNIYLIREMDTNEQVLRWISRNFNRIFENELNDWFTNEEVWPTKRTYKMFLQWFEVEICSMVLDLEESEVEKI